MYPLVLLIAVTSFYRRVPYWHGIASSPRRVSGRPLRQSPYGFAPEDNLAYAHVVRLHLAASPSSIIAIPAPPCFLRGP